MRKLFLSAAIIAALASCSKNEEGAAPKGDVIGFSTLNNRVTKAANTNDDETNSDYQVFAKSSVAATPAVWLIDEVVSSSDAIKSGNIYTWPVGTPTPTVDFYAYAPADGVTVGNIEPGKAIPISFVVPQNADIDFTVATPKTGATASNQGSMRGQVPLKFEHLLSKATLAVQLEGVADPSDATAENTGIAKSHTLTFSKAGFNVTKNTVTADAVTADPKGASEGDAASYTYNFATTPAVAFESTNALMFAPQDFDGCSIKLTDVVIKNGENLIFTGDLTYDIKDNDVNSVAKFEQGKAYAFLVTITAAETGLVTITFSSSFTGWDTTVVLPMESTVTPTIN